MPAHQSTDDRPPTAAAAHGDAPRIGAISLVWVAFGAVALLKLVLLTVYGPIFTPDSGGYVGYAQAMRASTAWITDAGLSTGAVPVLAIRMIGYPALIAGSMIVFGGAWPIALVIAQIMLSLAASYALHRLARELGFSPLIALAATFAQMLSLPLTFDQCILTDSFYTSFIMVAVAALIRGAIAGRSLAPSQSAAAGGLFALAFLLRDSMQVLILALLPLIALRVWLNGREHWPRSVLCCALILLPLFGSAELYKRWNEYRTGERFITTVAQITVMHGLAKVAASDPGLFGGSTPLDRVGARLFNVDPFGETTAANNALFAEGFKATDISRMAFAHYFRSWVERPATMFRLFRRNTSERVAKLSVRPLAAICETIEYATGDRRCYDYRDLYRALPSGFAGLPWTAPAFFLMQTAELTLSIVIFALFLLAVPAVVAQRAFTANRRLDPPTLIFATFWAVYVAWYGAHGIVHVEDRYMAPVLPLSLLAGLYAWQTLRDWLATRRRRCADVSEA